MTNPNLAEASSVIYTKNFDDLTNPFHLYAGESIISVLTQSDEQIALAVPKSLTRKIEMPEGLVPVYSAVRTQRLGRVAMEGLLRRKNSVGTIAPITHEAVFFVERPRSLAAFDRTRSIFARPYAPEPEDATYESPSGHFTFLELMIDARRALVTDQQIWDDAQRQYSRNEDYLSREELAEIIRPFARRYWSEAMPFVDYLAESISMFENPEVIIPFDVPAERLRVYPPTIE